MPRRVLVVTADTVGSRMAGPAIRSVNIARELARRGFEVTLAAPNRVDVAIESVTIEQLGAHDARGAIALARRHDAVVAQRLPASAMVALAGTETRVVYDLYDPLLHEAIAAGRSRPQQDRARLILETALLAGDAFVCASERQRDLWLGWLGALDRLDREEHARDPSFRHLVDVVPFGINTEAPKADGPALRGVLPGIDERSRVLVWGGGIWSWLDPLTVIRAVSELARTYPDVRLVFMGLRRPNARTAETAMAERAVALAHQLGMNGSSVLFNEDWVPYEQRGAWLAEADVGVSAHFETLETRYAFRTRLLDYLWAGLPIATTAGDVLADLVEEERLGVSLPAEDVDAWVAALRSLLGDERTREAARERAAAVRSRFEWPRVVEPLSRLLADDGHRIELPRRARRAGIRERYLQGRTLLTRGGANALMAALERRFSRPTRIP
jgi:glycosyltransferase involved in cell wall biosynthesis